MKYESFIAKRYSKSGRFFIANATRITILGVILGVGAVCLALSVHNGFEKEIRTRLLGTTSHISVFPHGSPIIENYNDLTDEIEKVEGVIAASAFILYKAAISSSSEGDGIIIRGIDLEKEDLTSNLRNDVKIGEYTFVPVPDENSEIPGMIIGKSLAERLRVYLGESVVLYSLKGEDLHQRSRPRVAKFYISGIFETGMHEFDAQMAYISLADAQKLFSLGDVATAVHMKLENIYDAERLQPIIDSSLNYRYEIVPWYIVHKNLFTWIAMEKLILFLGLILIVIVAAFSIISTLVMLTMEKRKEIGILKTLGSTPRSISKIFLINGLSIGIKGVAGGWILAVILVWIQNEFNIISLPPDLYFISYIPFEIHLIDFAAVGFITITLCLLAALYPARQASRVKVIDVLRQ